MPATSATKKEEQERIRQAKRDRIRAFESHLKAALSGTRPMMDLTVKPMFGGAGYYVNGVIFAAWFGGGIALKLNEADRAELIKSIPGAAVTQTPQYVEIPDTLLNDPAGLEEWTVRAVDYVLK